MYEYLMPFLGCVQILVTFPLGVLPLSSIGDSKHHDELGSVMLSHLGVHPVSQGSASVSVSISVSGGLRNDHTFVNMKSLKTYSIQILGKSSEITPNNPSMNS